MHPIKKGQQYYFGMKAHICVDDESSPMQSTVGTAANVTNVTQVDKLQHCDENALCTDVGYAEIE